nr:NAD(P)-dependent oxidoreductase [Cellulomonas composti]
MASYPSVHKIMLPTTLEDTVELPAGWRSVRYAVDAPVPDDALDASVLVVWGNGRREMLDAAARMPRLRWVASLAAGTEVVQECFPGVVVTSGSGLHDGPVAEHTLALVLACVRSLPSLVRAQDVRRWAGELGGIQPVHDEQVRTLHGAHVLIWGFGSIAARLAPLLTALGASVTGVARSAGTRPGTDATGAPAGSFAVVTEADLPRVLPQTDVVVDLLPATPATRHAVSSAVLAALPPRAFVVNVGRGATLDEDALLDAVDAGRLAGAALDVTAREPLPPDSPLWAQPRILISPHAAGGRPQHAGAFLTRALAAWSAGAPLPNLVS